MATTDASIIYVILSSVTFSHFGVFLFSEGVRLLGLMDFNGHIVVQVRHVHSTQHALSTSQMASEGTD